MAFLSSTIEGVYEEINKRQRHLGSLTQLDFSDEEYHVLLQKSKEILRRQITRKCDRHIFLTFACEYVKRNIYLSDYKFWVDFQRELEVRNVEQFPTFIANYLLYPTYKEVGITDQGEFKRQIVISLVDAIPNVPKLSLSQFVDFFCWYYQHYTESEINVNVIKLYKQKTGNLFSITEKTISRFSFDCRLLARAIDYITEQEIDLLNFNIIVQNKKFNDNFWGKQYNDVRLRLILLQEVLDSLVRKLKNHFTPERFLQEVYRFPNKTVFFPDRTTSPAYKVHQQWQSRTLPFGTYTIGNIVYRVVPFSWTWLETMQQWNTGEVISLRRTGFISYKKNKAFHVKIHGKTIDANKCFFENGTQCYIWAGKVPEGEPLIIDGKLFRGSEGINQEYSPELGFNQEGKPVIKAVLNWLKVYYPDKGGKQIRIVTSEGQEKIYTLQFEQPTGTLKLFRDTFFQIYSLDKPFTISIYLENRLLESKQIQLEPAFLFSSLTYQRIPPDTKRGWGEQYYYLFMASDKKLQFDEGLELEKLDVEYGGYSVYQINWKDTTRQFFLRVDKLAWAFQQQRYFVIQVNSQPVDVQVCLKKQQIYRFDERIRIYTNLQFESLSKTFQFLHNNEMLEIQGELKSAGEHQYVLSQATQEKLNTEIVDRHLYGEWLVLVYEKEQLLGQIMVVLIPALRVLQLNSEQPVLEKAQKFVKIISPHLMMWDARNNQECKIVLLPYYPKASIQPWDEGDAIPTGVTRLTSQEMKLALVFPAIGQDIEIKVHPTIFGFRLYQKQNSHVNTPYQPVSELDYYLLKTSVLYIFSKANSRVVLSTNEKTIWSGQTNSKGYLLCTDITFIQKKCIEEQTEFTIDNEGLKSTFFVRWTPRVLKINVVEDRVSLTLDGPRKTAVLVRFVDSNSKVLSERVIACRAEQVIENVLTSAVKTKEPFCYIVPVYRMSSGEILSSAQQWRLGLPRQNTVPSEWLRAGIGISDEMLTNFVLWSK